jgi:hypothetical protein
MASEAGYRRCHGEDAQVAGLCTEADAGNLCMEQSLVEHDKIVA